MLRKQGVDESKLCNECRRALNTIDTQYPGWVLTSTYEGTHSPGSLHYQHKAFDLRKTTFYSVRVVLAVLQRILGEGFDVVEEKYHFHIEWDPK